MTNKMAVKVNDVMQRFDLGIDRSSKYRLYAYLE